MKERYHAQEVESEVQAFWEDHKTFSVKEDLNKEKFYCLSMLPYPSGELHMGHVRNYVISDVIARYQRLLGKNVLQPMGWDAFGLPAENAAIKHKVAPSVWTYQNIDEMRVPLKRLGFALDWQREFATCTPDYYRWEQWLFLRMYKKGLVYRKNAMVNWDPVDETVLANEQVIDGRGWRSGALVERREVPQWFLKITAYADELLDGLDHLEGWPAQVKTMQRNWIGRSRGVTVRFAVEDSDQAIEVFTTRPDTLMGATYLAVAPQHALALEQAHNKPKLAAFIEKCRHIKVAEAELAIMEKEGMPTGLYALHPITGDRLPIWVANFVLVEYGSGAVMSVPAHDQRDFEFAFKYDIERRQVIEPADGSQWDLDKAGAYTDKGRLINSGQFDGLSSEQAFDAIADYLGEHDRGSRQIQFRLRDWGISRQRYWGAPIPIVYCKNCGTVPVSEKDLPVVLPEGIVLKHPGSPLKDIPEFIEAKCPVCGRHATRETDTFDTFMESSWYYARYCCPKQGQAMLDDRVNYWMPVDQYIGGIEHAVMHLLYARFIYKVLRDEGLVNSDEPFTRLLTQGMVLKDGAKMSKSKGNTVSPMTLLEKYGADTPRVFSIFSSPPEQSLEWSDSGVEGAHRFLKRIWALAYVHRKSIRQWNRVEGLSSDWSTLSPELKSSRRQIHVALQQAQFDLDRLQLNTVVSACMKMLNVLGEIVEESEASTAVMHEGFGILLRQLSPIAPHMTHRLWRELAYGEDIFAASWPKVVRSALKTERYEMVVQVNGKLRGKLQVPTEADESTIQALALDDERIRRFLGDVMPKKVIIVPKKLVNIVV